MTQPLSPPHRSSISHTRVVGVQWQAPKNSNRDVKIAKTTVLVCSCSSVSASMKCLTAGSNLGHTSSMAMWTLWKIVVSGFLPGQTRWPSSFNTICQFSKEEVHSKVAPEKHETPCRTNTFILTRSSWSGAPGRCNVWMERCKAASRSILTRSLQVALMCTWTKDPMETSTSSSRSRVLSHQLAKDGVSIGPHTRAKIPRQWYWLIHLGKAIAVVHCRCPHTTSNTPWGRRKWNGFPLRVST